MTGSRAALSALLMVFGVQFALPELREDPPSAHRPSPGGITGKIIASRGQTIALVQAICRENGKVYSPSTWDIESDRFAFDDLPGDANYDIRLVTASGRRMEGIDLSFVDARLLAMANQRRKDLALPIETHASFTRTDTQHITEYVRRMKGFADFRRIIYIHGHGRRATVLVELIRDRRFHSRKDGELIWRMELWYFERRRGGWTRLDNVERVIERRRLSAEDWRKLHIEYLPELTVHVDAAGASKPVHFRVPEKADPTRGRVPASKLAPVTAPHILGLEGNTKPPSIPVRRPASTRPSSQAQPAR